MPTSDTAPAPSSEQTTALDVGCPQPRTQTPGQICKELLQLLAGCCHPRVERLRAELGDSPDAQQIGNLRDEVLRLLTACYGPAEARRRLRELAEPA